MRIVAAALKYRDLIFTMPAPARHGHIIHQMARSDVIHTHTATQGFITDYGVFVDRVEARKIAHEAGQMIPGRSVHSTELFSEDVW